MTFANYGIDRLAWLLLLCVALLLSVLGMLIARVALGVLILILGVIALVTRTKRPFALTEVAGVFVQYAYIKSTHA